MATPGVLSEPAAALHDVLPQDIRHLKESIMVDIEARLSQKEDSLWRRGQVEIKRLQCEQSGIKVAIEKMHDGQQALVCETQKIRSALLDVTSKLEVVVSEMHQVLRVLHPAQQASLDPAHSPAPSVASTAASEAANCFSSSSIAVLNDAGTPGAVGMSWLCNSTQRDLSTILGSPEDADTSMESEMKSLRTPPRSGAPLGDHPSAGKVLSLVEHLSGTTLQSTGLKRLQLAECLDSCDVSTTLGASCSMISPPELAAPHTPQKDADLSQGGTEVDEMLTVELCKEPGFVTLGMEVNQTTDDKSLRIELIDEHGLVARHNSKQDNEAQRVRIGDRIIEVNGAHYDPHGMLQECKSKQRLTMTLLRRRRAMRSVADKAAANITTPVAWKGLRPDAEAFVPSGQKLDLPPGMLPPAFLADLAASMPLLPLNTMVNVDSALSSDEDLEVKRMLFA